MANPLDPFIPTFDARERFQLRVRAPAPLVYETAARFDMQSVGLVRGIFRLREWMMGAAPSSSSPFSAGFLAGAKELGWGVLREEPGRLFVAGAYCQPWKADVKFAPLGPESFMAFAEPGQVKIAWTLETEPIEGGHTRLGTETRVVTTSPDARQRFMPYWRWARFGIYTIRWLLLPAIRRAAEARNP